VTPVGRLIEREALLDEPDRLPARVTGLDDTVLVLRRDSQLRVDPALGFHLHGVDLALQAAAADLPVVVLDVPCLHNSLSHAPTPEFHAARRALLAKWPGVRPLHGSTGRLDDMDERRDQPTWYDESLELPARLAAETARAAELQATLEATQAELEDRRQHIANMESSLFWRARNAVHRALRRT
jgi:hypothetical protein